jgi:hypothetical protein
VKVSELQALVERVAKLHRDGGAVGKAKVLEEFSSVLGSAKGSMPVQTLVKKAKGKAAVGKARGVR